MWLGISQSIVALFQMLIVLVHELVDYYISIQVACHVNSCCSSLIYAISLLVCLPYITTIPSLLYTFQHSLLPFIFHYYHSSFTTTVHLSLLPFTFHYYRSSFATTLHHSLLPFTIHYYPSPFTTTHHHSLLTISIHYYPSAFTVQHSLLPFNIYKNYY